MEDGFLYRRVAEEIRHRILEGELKPGDRLPSLRAMTVRWGCTLGTVQRAYRELARQGLVTSRAGQGTRVVERIPAENHAPLRRASLVHRAEAFLLEVLTAGYSPPEVEESVRLALDRWRVISHEPGSPTLGTVRFSGSHDLVVAWLGGHFADVAPGFTLSIQFTGSLGGLIALAERKADLAGCHLWDEESDTYNLPFVRRIMPGRRVALVTLAHRCIGLIVSPGNPAGYRSLHDVVDAGARFVNRQSGSGTRVWLDASLRRMGIPTSTLLGYEMEKATHSEVARTIAGGEAEVGLGLEAAAHAFGLGFVPLTRERYDMAIPAEQMDTEPLHKLVNWLGGSTANTTISDLAGYDTSETGKIRWVE